MKKIFLLSAVTVLGYMIVIAQEKSEAAGEKGFLVISIGPSFPLGNFNSKAFEINTNTHPKIGIAKTGFNIDLRGRYHLVRNFGIAGSVFYNLFPYDDRRLKEQLNIPAETNLSIDPWVYYGMVAGPMVSATIAPKTFIDFSVMTGVISANSPNAVIGESGTTDVLCEDWSAAVPIRVGSEMRFHFQIGMSGYFGIGMNYFFAEPKVKTFFNGEAYEAHQQLSALAVNVGIGVSF